MCVESYGALLRAQRTAIEAREAVTRAYFRDLEKRQAAAKPPTPPNVEDAEWRDVMAEPFSIERKQD